MNNDILRQLAEALAPELQKAIGRKHTASGTPISTGYSHGPGGILRFPGVDPDVFQTIVGTKGILNMLPAKPSVYTNPTYQTITGVRDDSGSEKTDPCDNAPTAGLIKSCILTSVFGRYERATPELELNRLGQLSDMADPMDLSLVGSPIDGAGVFNLAELKTPADLLRNEVSRKFFELNVSFHRILSVQLWQGNPANNSAGGGYKEMTGFQLLVNTGHLDAQTGTSCPSIDSDLKNFNYARVDAGANGALLVDALSNMYRTRRDLAERTGVAPVRFVFVMRPELFWEITSVWPCSYLTYRCQVSGNQQVQINAADQVRMRDDMRRGKYLLLDGEQIEVILDDGIPVATSTTNANVTEGCQSSDIYLISMSVAGGRAVTFLEYFDYNNPSLSAALGASNMVLARVDGSFLVWPRQINQCVVWQAKVEPRLVIRTPWLCGRLQNVMFCPTQQARQPFPDDPYFVDGGRTGRPETPYYSLWNPHATP